MVVDKELVYAFSFPYPARILKSQKAQTALTFLLAFKIEDTTEKSIGN